MQIELSTASDAEHRKAILAPLIAYNQAQTGRSDPAVTLAVLLRDAEGKVEGGMWGTLSYDWFKLSFAFLPEHRRGNRLGARILSTLEADAAARGARGMWTTSFSFQAPGFYEKLGYRAIGRLDDRPPGYFDTFLAKTEGFAQDGATLVVTENPSEAEREAVRDPLVIYSNRFAGAQEGLGLDLLVRDDDGAIVGGLHGRTGRRWLFIDLLGLPEHLRHAGLGTELMDRAEAEARARGCIGVWLDTFSFQARPFYERRGYRVFAEIADYPPGHSRFFLTKRLDPA
jgi:GNAT superfamily N-acetyltransferase